MKIFLNTLNNKKNEIDSEIIAFVACNKTFNLNYYENNDVNLETIDNIDMIGSLPFIAVEDKVVNYISGENHICYKKNTTDENFISFIKEFIRSIDDNKVDIYTDMTIEEFITFKRKLLSYYTEDHIIDLLSTRDKESSTIDLDVAKEILKKEKDLITNMNYYPYHAVILNFEYVAKMSNGKYNYEELERTINKNKNNFIVLSKFKFEIMKFSNGLPL